MTDVRKIALAIGLAALLGWAWLRLGRQVTAACDRMMDAMPESFPPKRVWRLTRGAAMLTDFERALYDAYQGEVTGQAFCEALAETAPNQAASVKWRALAQLEAATKNRLRPFVVAMGQEASADPKRIEEGEVLAQRYAGMDWATQMESMLPVLRRALAAFEERERESEASEEYGKVSAALTAHERALLSFVERELAGEPDSLAAVEAILDAPVEGNAATQT